MTETNFYGYTTPQWVTVFKKYPPKSIAMVHIAESRKLWIFNHVKEPMDSPVPPRFRVEWEAFVSRTMDQFTQHMAGRA